MVVLFLLTAWIAFAPTVFGVPEPCPRTFTKVGGFALIHLERGPITHLIGEKKPWHEIEAGSDQASPVYIGATPYQMEVLGERLESPVLQESLKKQGDHFTNLLLEALGRETAQFEMWPSEAYEGRPNWVISRWREGPNSEWQWIDPQVLEQVKSRFRSYDQRPIFAKTLDPQLPTDAKELFADFLEFDDLYTKPLFGDAVWTTRDGKHGRAAWLSPDEKQRWKESIKNEKDIVARILPQPPRFNEKPLSFELSSSKNGVQWPHGIVWESPSNPRPKNPAHSFPFETKFPADYQSRYIEDIRIFSGKKKAKFPLSGKEVLFKKKSTAQPDHQLELMADYLEERYQAMGLKTIRQRFLWRGIWQSNVMAIIPGRNKGSANRPVLLADHYDTVFGEDTFSRNGKRETVPGADDNVSATAALMRAAEFFTAQKEKGVLPEHDILLTHLTGEEFPADDLGARKLLSAISNPNQFTRVEAKDNRDFVEYFSAHRQLSGVVLFDMIAYRPPKHQEFQIHVGRDPASIRMGSIAKQASERLVPSSEGWVPRIRGRYERTSYLFNADSNEFSNYGIPIVFFNGPVNGKNYDTVHPYYHKSTDTLATLDPAYARHISQTGILTVAAWAGLR